MLARYVCLSSVINRRSIKTARPLLKIRQSMTSDYKGSEEPRSIWWEGWKVHRTWLFGNDFFSSLSVDSNVVINRMRAFGFHWGTLGLRSERRISLLINSTKSDKNIA